MSETIERTVSMDETVTRQMDRKRKEYALENDVDEPPRSELVNLACALVFGQRGADGEDLDLSYLAGRRELLEDLHGFDVLADRTLDSKGRARLGGSKNGDRDALVAAIFQDDE